MPIGSSQSAKRKFHLYKMKIIIAGAYAIGTHLAKLLSRSNHDTVLIDESEARLADISGDYDLMTYLASPASF